MDEKQQSALLEKVKGEAQGVIDAYKTASETEKKALQEKLTALETELKSLESLKEFKSKEVTEEVIKLATELKALKEAGAGQPVSGLRDQIKAWVVTNQAAIKNIKAGQKADLTPMEIKLNSPMLPSNTYNGSSFLPMPEFAPGIVDIVRVQPTFWDYIKKGRVGSAVWVWVNKTNPEGAAAFIGPGVAKPGISFELTTETSNAKKVAESLKVSTEVLEDIDGMTSWIQQELRYQLMAKVNTTLMTGTASSTVPAGIQTISVPYSLTTVATTNPNTWDAIRAAVAQLRSGNLQGPVTAFVNPIDYANMVLTKAISQGQYMNNPPETGATIVEDNNIPVGFVQVALLDYYKILIYKDFTISWGWENDDFTKNLVTVIGEMRFHQFFSENHTGAFIYDSIQDIKDAIVAV